MPVTDIEAVMGNLEPHYIELLCSFRGPANLAPRCCRHRRYWARARLGSSATTKNCRPHL
eukprot:scaffold348754_cov17-Prasinocladus_malaysianus.AAC.1